jgi:hypothetical protein
MLHERGYEQLNEEELGKEGGVWLETETLEAVSQCMKETNMRRMKLRREVVAEMWAAEPEARKEFYREEAAKQRKKGVEEAAEGDPDND